MQYTFLTVDTGNLNGLAPCYPASGVHENNRITERNVPGQVTLMFQPFHKYGACYTAQDGGYVNVGRFNEELDTSKGVNLLVKRADAPETYRYYYFLAEIM